MTVHRYWDSDCFLGWLLEEADKLSACQEVLEAARSGKTVIVTSALTIAEVLAIRHKQKIAKDKRDKVIAFFKSDYIIVRNITRRVAEKARDLVWDAGIAPKDALHVATAMDAKMTLLNTFDAGLIAHDGTAGINNIEIKIPSYVEPRIPGL